MQDPGAKKPGSLLDWFYETCERHFGGRILGSRFILRWLGVPALVILAALAVYWVSTRQRAVRCILGDAICSLTVATYALCILTALVFAGTLFAGILAKRAYDRDRRAGLAVQRCERDDECAPHSLAAYLTSDDDTLVFREPEGFDRQDWGVVNFDCISVGSSPLIGSILRTHLIGGAETLELNLPLGSLPSKERVHYALFVGPEVAQDALEFVEAIHDNGSNEFDVTVAETVLKVNKQLFTRGDEIEQVLERIGEVPISPRPEAPPLPAEVPLVRPEPAPQATAPAEPQQSDQAKPEPKPDADLARPARADDEPRTEGGADPPRTDAPAELGPDRGTPPEGAGPD